MKIRTGFVSNSSSTSFCIIGIDRDMHIEELIEAEKIDLDDCYSFGYGVLSGKVVTFYGSPDYIQCAGVDAKDLLERFSLPQARKHVQQLLKQKLKVDVPLSCIDLHFGEAGDG